MNVKTLSLAALAAALCAIPTAVADVDIVVGTHSIECITDDHLPPVTDPYVTADDCNVAVRGGPDPVDGCPPVGSPPALYPRVWLDAQCTLHARIL